ncbi:MAG TPA: PAS domain S-box protein [Gemmataceae bacterium]|jgi:diguanylate cyclase (GGDEF)-like protein/PAS domain S-box-containing protein|nr:PAS domain S-box protein [Gemmataceae bacterium]
MAHTDAEIALWDTTPDSPWWDTSDWLQAILDSACFSIIAVCPNGIIRFCNAAAQNWLGYSQEELVGQASPLLYHDPELVARRAEELSQRLGRHVSPGLEVFTSRARHGLPEENDWIYVRKDGSRFPVRLSISAIRDRAGEIQGYMGIGIDLTERRQIEEALRASEAKFRLAFEGSAIGMALMSIGGEFLHANSVLCELLGYSEAELRHLDIVQCTHSEDFAVAELTLSNLVLGLEKTSRSELRWVHRDGSVLWGLTSLSLVHDNRGQPLQFVAQVQDTTARRRAEEALRESEAKYRAIFDNAVEGFFQTTPEGRFIILNPALARIYGYSSPQEVIDHIANIAQELYVDPHRREEFLRLMEAQGVVHGFEFQVRRKDGSHAWVSESTRAVCDGSGKLLYYEGTVEDITMRKSYVEQLEEYRRDLEEANVRLQEMAVTDDLTGLRNRITLRQKLAEECQRVSRYHLPLALMMMDVDRFKSFNDTYGHPAGDEVLRTVARLLQEKARTTDIVARYGGEEFAVLLPNTDLEGAAALAERFRLAIDRASWGRRAVTASFGVAAWLESMTNPDELIAAADQALYRAKENGRNRVER